MDFEITNRTKEKISLSETKKTLQKIVKIIRVPREAVVSVVFLNSKDMQALNRDYRKRNEATDVLAFPFTKSPKQKGSFTIPDFIRRTFGEIFLCRDLIREKAFLRSMALEEYQKLLLVHALLHLNGMDHKDRKGSEEMEELEQAVLEKLARPARETKHKLT